jgi:4a-hydroxytetrahydrobiopterin dehydratase
MREKLNDAEVADGLSQLPEWRLANSKLHREYKFADFTFAFGFMATASTAIEKLNHHPEWCNVYNRVTVDLTTHDAGGITTKDFELARLLEGIAKKLA